MTDDLEISSAAVEVSAEEQPKKKRVGRPRKVATEQPSEEPAPAATTNPAGFASPLVMPPPQVVSAPAVPPPPPPPQVAPNPQPAPAVVSPAPVVAESQPAPVAETTAHAPIDGTQHNVAQEPAAAVDNQNNRNPQQDNRNNQNRNWNNNNNRNQQRFNNNNNQQQRNNGQQDNQNRRLSRREQQRLRHQQRQQQRQLQRQQQQQNQEGQEIPALDPANPPPPPVNVRDYQIQTVEALTALAELKGIANELTSLWKHDIIFALLREQARCGGAVYAEGVLEIVQDGSGYLRNEFNSFKTCPEDAFVPQQTIKKYALRPGDRVYGATKTQLKAESKEKQRFSLTTVERVNGLEPEVARRIPAFDSLTPTFPTRRINLETSSKGIEMRITNFVTPLGFGQRGLIVAPPRTGKTVLMQMMANAICENHPNAKLIILLIDERPEEVTDMKEHTRMHKNAVVYSSTFDEPPECHVQVTNVVGERARRMVEQGEDVIILLDSITRLARAFNTVQPHSGKILTGGVDANALQKPKRFFGAARNITGGGSLTIIATALVETGSKMDEVIFEEFKGTGNMEIVLDRDSADKRVYPAINVMKSGTRKEDILVSNRELEKSWELRKFIAKLDPADAMSGVIHLMKATSSNEEFITRLSSTINTITKKDILL